MSKAEILRELPNLSREERLEIRATLDQLDGPEWLVSCELDEADRELLTSRLQAYRDSPTSGSSWQDVEARIRSALRE